MKSRLVAGLAAIPAWAADPLYEEGLSARVGAIYDYNLDVTKGRARGSFEYQFAGPVLYLNAGF